MPVVPINYWAVLLCGIVSIVLGFVWYGPLFGKLWMSLSGQTAERIEAAKAEGKGKMYRGYALAFIGALVMAYVLAHSLVFGNAYLGTSGISGGLMVGFWNWLGFIAPVTLGMVLWDGKPWKLWFLNNAYQLLLLLIMGVILSVS